MRLFISEFICSGAWSAPEVPSSLAKEGRAMLTAIVKDFAYLKWQEPIHIETTWDIRFGEHPFTELPNVTVHCAASPTEEAELFRELLKTCEAALVIAPEFDQILEQRVSQVREADVRSLNASPAAIRLCSDKYKFHDYCVANQIRTIPTVLLSQVNKCEALREGRIVIKLRDGAGSMGIHVYDSLADVNANSPTLDPDKYIAQPFISGKACSIAAFYDETGVVPLVSAEQLLSDDGMLSYIGGQIPGNFLLSSGTAQTALHESPHRLRSTATLQPPQFVSQLSDIGLNGYIGMDYILPNESDAKPILVEVNPRLTTSYVGYRCAYAPYALAAHFLPGHELVCPIVSNIIRFDADGMLDLARMIHS